MSGANWGVKLLKIVVILAVLGAAGVYAFLRKSEDMMAGSAAKQSIAWLGGIRSSLQVYYGDTDGKYYPESLEVLLENRKYMSEIPEARIYAKTQDGDFERVHRGAERQVKSFRSLAEADDSGGWGYIPDPAGREYGTVFVNCTHLYMGTGKGDGVPWNTF